VAETAIADAVNWLIDTFAAAATLGAATPPVTIIDGPSTYNTAATLLLWVGMEDPDDEEGPPGADDQQEWAGLGALHKDEMLRIPCVARAWSGGGTMRSTRAAAFGIVQAAGTLVRANASLGGMVLVTMPGVTNVRLRQGNTPSGLIADVAFDIAAKARI
jgi:hypothetical protein